MKKFIAWVKRTGLQNGKILAFGALAMILFFTNNLSIFGWMSLGATLALFIQYNWLVLMGYIKDAIE